MAGELQVNQRSQVHPVTRHNFTKHSTNPKLSAELGGVQLSMSRAFRRSSAAMFSIVVCMSMMLVTQSSAYAAPGDSWGGGAVGGNTVTAGGGYISVPPEEVLQARPRGCKQVVAERVEQERAAVVEQERAAAVPLPQIAALRSFNATAAATSETTVPPRLLHQELMSRPPRCPSRR